MDRDEVATRIGDDAAAIAVTQREAGKRIDVPIDEEGIALCLLVEGLIVGRRGRRGGAGWLKHRGSGVVRLGKDVGCGLTEVPKVEDVIERDLGRHLPGGAVVGVHVNAARVGRAGNILYAILDPGVESVEVLIEVCEVAGCTHVEHASIHREVTDGRALDVKLLAGKKRTRGSVPGVRQKAVARRVDGSIRIEGSGARRSPDRGQVDSQTYGGAVGELVTEPGERPMGVALEVGDEFVE